MFTILSNVVFRGVCALVTMKRGTSLSRCGNRLSDAMTCYALGISLPL